MTLDASRRAGIFAALTAVFLASTSSSCFRPPPPSYDLVIANGRVMDPESGLNAVRHVGINAGKVEAISESALDGRRVVDAANHVVAPGFIDLHEHGQEEAAYRLMVRDGVTSAFELEVGTGDVPAWYAARDGGQLVNYGVSVGHIPARKRVLGDPGPGLMPAGIGGTGSATDTQVAAMEEILRTGLAQGALGVGIGTAYTPGATMAEIERMFQVAGTSGAAVYIHIRGGAAGLRETVKAAAAGRAPVHIAHVNATGSSALPEFFGIIQAARDAGQDVTTEAYPYSASMTEIQSALFDDWPEWTDERFAQHQLVSTGERLTRKTFEQARKTGGTVIIHARTEEQTRAAIASPLTMIASDGFFENGRAHPRTSGSYAKVLGRYVREERVVPLMDALRRMTLQPAQRLERRAPAMANKGRLRVGADADVTIFDPARVIDRATYDDGTIPSAGIPYVIVGGQVVVDGGEITTSKPGRAVRAPLTRE